MSSPPPDPPDRSTPKTATPTEHWDEYWRFGFVTSCGETFSGNYEGGLASVWEAFFSTVPDGSTILDVGTGNGAIAMIANRVSRNAGKRCRIHGIDLADINPLESVGGNVPDLAGIEFHPRTAIECSGFKPASIDIICGQYALEYAPLDLAIRELGRICAPGAQAMFVLHHNESVVLETAAEELRVGALICDSGFFRHAADLVRRMGELGGAAADTLARDHSAESSRSSLNQAAAALMSAAASSPRPEMIQAALNHVSETIRHNDLGGGPARIEDYARQLRANLSRLRDLQAASVDEKKLIEIINLFNSSGFACERAEQVFHQPGKLAGRVLRAQFEA